MTRKAYDRVEETTTTTGTGPVDLDGATAAHQEFRDVFADGEAVYYAIVHTDQAADEWETGLGEMDKPNNALKRISVDESSEADDSKVAFSTGEKTVICTPLAARVAFVDEDTVLTNRWRAADDTKLGWGGTEGADPTYYGEYDATAGRWHLASGAGDIFRVDDGQQVLDFQATPTVTGTNVVLETRSLTGGNGIDALGDLSADRTVAISTDGVGTDEIDQSIAPTWMGEHNFHGGISTSSGALNLSATTNTDQLNLRTDGNVAMANSLKVGGTGAASLQVDIEATGNVLRLNQANASGLSSWRYVRFDRDGAEAFSIGETGATTVPNLTVFDSSFSAITVFRNDGNVAMANSLKVGGTGAASGGTLEVAGDININPTSTYTLSNVTTDRTVDANSTTTAELADVLGTLINDLGLDT